MKEFTTLTSNSAAYFLDENAAGIATPEEEEEGDDENVIWSGFISVKQFSEPATHFNYYLPYRSNRKADAAWTRNLSRHRVLSTLNTTTST